jgi:hypothetical protein
MKRAAGLLILLAAQLGSQTPVRLTKTALAAPVAATKIPQGMLANLEKTFDSRLVAFDPLDPVDMLGGTRGLYVQGFGTIFTTELSLIVTPGNFPIARPTFTPEIRAQVHQRKVARLPKLEELMKEMVKVTALTLTPMPDDQKIVLAVRLRYLVPEEDTSGLPAQIVMTADKKAAQTGDIKTVVE